ncbi:hypothetical protein [Streptomyces sp. NPDC054783]
MDVTRGTGGVRQVLLADQHEGAFRHAAGRHGPLRVGHLGERATEVHGARPACVCVRPGHAALDGQVELEDGGGPPEPPVRTAHPGREPVAVEGDDLAGVEVEEGHVGGRQLPVVGDPHAGVDAASVQAQHAFHAAGDGL